MEKKDLCHMSVVGFFSIEFFFLNIHVFETNKNLNKISDIIYNVCLLPADPMMKTGYYFIGYIITLLIILIKKVFTIL